jgi:uncharacterized protein YecE (DUF72 family)
VQYYIGCSGWSYSAWQGPFYPSNIESNEWLSYYAHIFDYVEIDSSFYAMPNIFMVKNWNKRTPENFRFTAKFPKIITHDKRLKDVSNELNHFFQSMLPLADKILTLLLQLPPSLKIAEGIENLRNLIPELDNRFRYAIEVRDRSWFQDLAYSFFKNNNICMVWSQLAELTTPPIVTTDFLYMRFIGDRSISEKDFGKIQKDRVSEMKNWADRLQKVIEEDKEDLNLAIVSANNHYAGFGPMTANIFRRMVGLQEAQWKDENNNNNNEKVVAQSDDVHDSVNFSVTQSKISDFMPS